jgi:predicted lipid-binding transport protein (Tim44 family)
MLDPLNLILLAAAIVLFWRLYLVLGTRTGNERPPLEPYVRREGEPAVRPPSPPDPAAETLTNTVDETMTDRQSIWKGFAAEGSPAAAGLAAIVQADPSFTPKLFLSGAKRAYEMIIEAFAGGDKPSLKPLLTREVYEGFSRVIGQRAAEGLRLDTQFVGIKRCDIADANVDGSRAAVTVRIVSEVISVTRNGAGEVVEGDPKELRETTDVWTFERDTTSRDPNWKLAATDEDA